MKCLREKVFRVLSLTLGVALGTVGRLSLVSGTVAFRGSSLGRNEGKSTFRHQFNESERFGQKGRRFTPMCSTVECLTHTLN